MLRSAHEPDNHIAQAWLNKQPYTGHPSGHDNAEVEAISVRDILGYDYGGDDIPGRDDLLATTGFQDAGADASDVLAFEEPIVEPAAAPSLAAAPPRLPGWQYEI